MFMLFDILNVCNKILSHGAIKEDHMRIEVNILGQLTGKSN